MPALRSTSGVGRAEDGDEDSGGDGKRDAPPLAGSGGSSVVAPVSVASQDRFEAVALGADILVFTGDVGDRIWAGAGDSLGRLLEDDVDL